SNPDLGPTHGTDESHQDTDRRRGAAAGARDSTLRDSEGPWPIRREGDFANARGIDGGLEVRFCAAGTGKWMDDQEVHGVGCGKNRDRWAVLRPCKRLV